MLFLKKVTRPIEDMFLQCLGVLLPCGDGSAPDADYHRSTIANLACPTGETNDAISLQDEPPSVVPTLKNYFICSVLYLCRVTNFVGPGQELDLSCEFSA